MNSQPQIDVFTTSILSSGAVRGRHERVLRHLQSARLEFKTHDVASDDEAKSYWKRKNGGSTELPCVLVNGERVGSVEDLDEAVEFGELRQFLRLDSPAPPPGPTATLSDFSSLSLTPEELASLEAELSSTSLSSELSDTYSSTSLATTSYSAFPTAERVKRVQAIPGSRPLAEDRNDELDGIVLSPEEEAEAEALAREWAAEEPQGVTQGLFSSSSRVGKTEERPAKLDHSGPSEEATSIEEATTIEGPGGASLSAPLAQVGALKLSKEEQVELEEEVGGPIEVEPPTRFEDRLEDAVGTPVKKGPVSGRQEVEKLRNLLDADQGDTGEGSCSTVPSFGLASVDDKVAHGIREGFL